VTVHACNNPLTCPECIRRFWLWAQSHTRGRVPKSSVSAPNFYEAAAKFADVDARSR
jgi:hypothetical protein